MMALHTPHPTSPARDLPCLARCHPADEPLLRDWLLPWHDALFRWTMAMAPGDDGRRALAETAVAVQRLRGRGELGGWLYDTALQAAQQQRHGLRESALAGLPPELRALLRLVARGALRREEAAALRAQRMSFVRRRLLQTRLAHPSAAMPLDLVPSADDGQTLI